MKARDGLDLKEEGLCTVARQYTGPDRRGPRSYEILEGFLGNGLVFSPRGRAVSYTHLTLPTSDLV